MLRSPLHGQDPGDAWDVPRAPWDPGYSLGTPLGHLRTPLGPQGTLWDPSGTSPYGQQKQQYLNKYTTPEALNYYVRTCLLRSIA